MGKDHDLPEVLRGYAFLAPLCALLLVFVFLPVAGTVLDSLKRDVTFLPRRFIGLANYRSLWSDPGFWQSLRFTALFTLVSVPLELALGLAFALLSSIPPPSAGFYAPASSSPGRSRPPSPEGSSS
jgi:ABC-type sugar transport system permease subunit